MKKTFTLSLLLCLCSAAFAQNSSPYWSVTGNNNETGTSKLGTTNKISLHFYTNNSQRMYIDSSTGNVGIGTPTPITKLHVIGSGSFGNRVTTSNATRALNLADTAAVMRILRVDYSNAPSVELISRKTADGSDVAYWDMYAQPTDASFRIRDRVSGLNDRLTIAHGTGYVGIGTSSPVYKLEVNGSINVDSGAYRFAGDPVLKYNVANQSIALGNAGGIGTRLNIAVGYNALISNTTGQDNTALGHKALYSDNTGYSNIAVGSHALYTNTTSNNLIAIGDSAMYNTNGGNYNISVGSKTLYANTTGSYATAVGYQSLYHNTSGSVNTAVGYRSLYANTTGYNNTAVGVLALVANNTGYNNNAFGYQALYNNTTGSNNTATGNEALIFNTTGSNNIAIGHTALFNNTTTSDNTAVGFQALYSNNQEDANRNTAVGENALYNNSEGQSNTAVGTNASINNTAGNQNTSIGYYALANYSGENNTGLGAFADMNGAGYVYSTAIGWGGLATASAQVRVGNSFVSSIGGYANWTNISDGRVKKNIKQNVPGLAFINKLQPVTYNLDLDAADKIVQRPAIKDKEGNAIKQNAQETEMRTAKQKILYTGFVAQDVEKAAKDMNYDFSGVDAPKNDKDLYGLRYAEFVVPLVKAVQELSKSNDAKDSAIADLQNQINQLKTMIVSGSNATSSTLTPTKSVTLSSAAILQNMPNPFTNSTTIQYSLPSGYTNAMIVITDKSGKTLKTIALNGSYSGTLQVESSTLASGAYQYALIVDGSLVDTKQMIRMK